MPLFNWNDVYKTNIPLIDEQHKQLIDYANELDYAIQEKQGHDKLKKILTGLVSYTKLHFETEEQFIKEKNRNEYYHHKEQHNEIIEKLKLLLKSYSPANPEIPAKVLALLKFWVIQHIRKNDKRYVEK